MRPALEEERPLVFDSWIRTFGDDDALQLRIGGEPYVPVGPRRGGRLVAPSVWYGGHRARVRRLVETTLVHVATLRSMPDGLLGWICHERKGAAVILHYCFVLREARRRGIGAALIRHAIDNAETVRLSHRTPEGDALMSAVMREHETAA